MSVDGMLAEDLCLVLVECTPFQVWVRLPLTVLGKYLAELVKINHGQVNYVPSLIAAIQFNLTGNPVEVWK